MGRRGWGSALLLCALAFAMPVADAHTKRSASNVAISRATPGGPGEGNVEGTLSSPNASCVRSRPIAITRGGNVVTTTKSRADGTWRATAAIPRCVELVATAREISTARTRKHRHTCSAARSVPFSTPALLDVSVTGDGTVFSHPPGIECSASSGPCQSLFGATGTALQAEPDNGATFIGWGGACSGTSDTCDVIVDSDKSVTATFTEGLRELTVEVTGPGSVTGTGIDCSESGGDCTQEYTPGTEVTLTASPHTFADFDDWGEACTGTSATCQLTMDGDKTASATFSSPLPLVGQILEALGL